MRKAALLIFLLQIREGFNFLDQISRPTTGGNYAPVIIIPGDGGNQLEARLDKPHDPTGCPQRKDWYRLWLDVWSLKGKSLRCWADNIKLVYNTTNRMSRNVHGVYTRVPGWGDTSGVEYLDPSWSAWVLADAGNYMKDMVGHLESVGLERGTSIRAAPYDFRFAPHSQGAYFTSLKNLIEETSAMNNNKPVAIISHSMGGLFGLHFLQNQSQQWLDRYIVRFIPLNTPWIGATVQLNTYASGYNLGISVIDPAVIRQEQRSYETGVYILPHPYHWTNSSQILVQTPRRAYTVRDYTSFFHDIGFPQGIDMLNNVVNITRLEEPKVALSCIYSLGVDTPVGLRYGNGFPDEQPSRLMGNGDGTVTQPSLAYCHRWMSRNGNRVMVFNKLNHGQVLKDKNVLNFIQSQIAL